MNLIKELKKAGVTNFSNPFNRNCFESAHIHIWKDGTIRASVDFVAGNTCGEQKFRGYDFGKIVKEIETFLGSL